MQQDLLKRVCLYPEEWLKKKGSLFNFFFPKFCIPAFSGMLILVKYMHAYNFLGQEQIQQIINFSISSLIQLIR